MASSPRASASIATRLLALLLLALLAACGPSKQDSQYAALMGYGKALRWGGLEDATQYLAPEYRAKHPLTSLEINRWQQVQISGYSELGDAALDNDGQTLRQTVRISVINRHTGVERQIIDRQEWRYDPEAKRWWLWSGLPRLTH